MDLCQETFLEVMHEHLEMVKFFDKKLFQTYTAIYII